jgi:chain length determinant protein tyrosine kinase EpsG
MNRNPPPHVLEAALAVSPAPLRHQRMGDILVEAGRLAPEDVDRILALQPGSGKRFGQLGQELGLLSAEDVRFALSVQFDFPYLSPDSLLSPELVMAHQPESAVAEQWRGLRSQLALRGLANSGVPHRLALLSPDRREGRSVAAANLAIAWAQLGHRTLLIDADLRQPRQHLLFNLGHAAGLSDGLAGRGLAEGLIKPISGLRGLSVLPAGTPVPNPQELLARPQMTQLLQALDEQHDLLVFDAPATSQCSDGLHVAAHCGAAVLLARRDVSSLPRLLQLSQGLRDLGVRVLGTVLRES